MVGERFPKVMIRELSAPAQRPQSAPQQHSGCGDAALNQAEVRMHAPKVSIVVVNFRGVSSLVKCLKSVLATDYPDFEVIVVDSLTSNIEEVLRREIGDTSRVRVVHFERDVGAAGSHNIGAWMSSPESEYLVFLDNDVVVRRDWLKWMVEAAKSLPNVGCVQAKVVSQSNVGKMDHAGLAIDLTATWLSTYGFSEEVFLNPLVLFVASSAALLTPRDLYFKLGGFDSSYFIYDDDTDYSWRTRLAGYNVVLEPRAVVYHEDKISSRLRFDKLYFGFRNRLQNIVKNMEVENMLPTLLITLYLGYLSSVLLALAGRREATAYILAAWKILVNLPKTVLKRRMINSFRRVSDRVFREKGFIQRNLLGAVAMTRALLIRAVSARTL
jgi:GT2 family glycosyltransferase